MDETKLLEFWSKFHKMSYEKKRALLTEYLARKLGISCEVRLYRSITRVSLQTHKEKLGKLLKDDIAVQQAFRELNLAPTTALNWYITTKSDILLKPNTTECKNCPLNGLCEYSLPTKFWKGIQDKYPNLLVSKRLQHVLIKKEKILEAITIKTSISDEDTVRKHLRRLIQKQYYDKNIELSRDQQKIVEVLKEQKIGAVAVIKWCYIINEAKENLTVENKQLLPEQIESIGLEKLRKDIFSDKLEVKL